MQHLFFLLACGSAKVILGGWMCRHTDRLVLLGYGSYLVAKQNCSLGGLLSRSNYSAWQEAIFNPVLLYCFNLSVLNCVSFVFPHLSHSSPHTHVKWEDTGCSTQTPYHQHDITSQILSRGILAHFGVSHSISICVTILLTHWLPYCTFVEMNCKKVIYRGTENT